MTTLRVTVKDISKVADEKEWKKNGALGLILKDNGVQAIYGPKADVLKSNIQDIIRSVDNMKLLTLNCHSWQEENQIEKIKYLAKIIKEKQYDVIALQEVSQHNKF